MKLFRKAAGLIKPNAHKGHKHQGTKAKGKAKASSHVADPEDGVSPCAKSKLSKAKAGVHRHNF